MGYRSDPIMDTLNKPSLTTPQLTGKSVVHSGVLHVCTIPDYFFEVRSSSNAVCTSMRSHYADFDPVGLPAVCGALRHVDD